MSLLWVKYAGLKQAAVNPSLEHLYGSGAAGMEHMFAGHPTRPIPWETASRLKTHHDYDKDLVNHAIHNPKQYMDLVNPANLHGTQPSVTRQGLHYYLNNPRYEQTGETFHNNDQLMNRHPVVYTRDPNPNNPNSAPQSMILSGHHRAAAALLRGENMLAIHVHGPWGERRG